MAGDPGSLPTPHRGSEAVALWFILHLALFFVVPLPFYPEEDYKACFTIIIGYSYDTTYAFRSQYSAIGNFGPYMPARSLHLVSTRF